MTKKQFIHRAMKDWDPTSGHDEKQKTKVQNALRHLGINDILFDQVIFIHKETGLFQTWQPEGYESKEALLKEWWINKPDILSKNHNLIIEIDGTFHTDSIKGVKQTGNRDEHYDIAGIRHVTLTPDFIDQSTESEILTYIFERL